MFSGSYTSYMVFRSPTHLVHKVKVKVEVKLSLYRCGQAHRGPAGV
jgi:hypothetical protein